MMMINLSPQPPHCSTVATEHDRDDTVYLPSYGCAAAVQVVHYKSSDKHDFEGGSKQMLAQIDLKHIGDQDPTYSECVDASMEWQFCVHECINCLLKWFLKFHNCPTANPNLKLGVTLVLTVTQVYDSAFWTQ